MKRLLLFIILLTYVTRLSASVNGGFGLDAFNRAVSATMRNNAVFSPFSFEIDCVVFSEAVDTLSRSKLAETMGILNGLELAYLPQYKMLSSTDNTNFTFRTARGFCLPDERKTLASYRHWLQKSFAAEAFSYQMREGAQCWFRARMDGDMEDFVLKNDIANANFYSYYDLVSARFYWQEPFPTNNTKTLQFHIDEKKEVACHAMSDVRDCDILRCKRYSALRLRLSSDTFLFTLTPFGKATIRDLRAELSSKTIHDFLIAIKSTTNPDVLHGSVSVTIPKLDVVFESDLKLPFDYFRFPTKDMERMEKDIRPRYLRQRVRFQLDERGVGGCFASDTPASKVIRLSADMNPVILDKPFLFFIFHEPTATIPIVGQFMGE